MDSAMMRPQFQCVSCGGTYFEMGPGGPMYQHICPPKVRDRGGRLIDTPNPRDENVKVDRETGEWSITSEGEGVKCLTDKQLQEPRWITKMAKRTKPKEDRDDA